MKTHQVLEHKGATIQVDVLILQRNYGVSNVSELTEEQRDELFSLVVHTQ